VKERVVKKSSQGLRARRRIYTMGAMRMPKQGKRHDDVVQSEPSISEGARHNDVDLSPVTENASGGKRKYFTFRVIQYKYKGIGFILRMPLKQ
jgi:hypothetical protein